MSESLRVSLSPSDGSDEMDFIFRNYFNRPISMQAYSGWRPATDMFETDTEIILIIDLAGIDMAHTSLVQEGNTIKISGSREDVEGFAKRNYQLMEISYGPFEREFVLSSPVVQDSVEARYVNGIVTVRMKKLLQQTGTIHIEVGSE
ncbi:MAG: Hsp20/alpha crystallin family protein [bacterium]|nr:Hsp20/alpha crystallin family protein [bacterium]